jgi:hypothetical protein
MNRLYLVKVAQSRTGKVRSYRAFIVENEHIREITSNVCRDARVTWNNKLGTIDMREAYAWQDGPALASKWGSSVVVL